jgi:uncharacterized protein (TIGR02246 family)
MKKLFILFTLLASITCFAQKGEEKDIRALLQLQTEAWNKGDLEGFMQTYWKNDSLMFIGKTGVTRGWRSTLDNYKKGYPDKEAMGQLSFDIIEVKPLSKDYFFVVGKWMLHRTRDDLSGHYTLLLRKIKGQWKIIADHSS